MHACFSREFLVFTGNQTTANNQGQMEEALNYVLQNNA